MNNLLVRMSLLFTVSMLTVSCHRERHDYTAADLSRHPAILKSELDYCQVHPATSLGSETYCRNVQQVADQVLPLISQSQENPEAFGEQILTAQMTLSKTQAAIKQAEQNLTNLQAQHAAAEVVQAAQDKIATAQADAMKLHDQVQMMLAVVGLNNPE